MMGHDLIGWGRMAEVWRLHFFSERYAERLVACMANVALVALMIRVIFESLETIYRHFDSIFAEATNNGHMEIVKVIPTTRFSVCGS